MLSKPKLSVLRRLATDGVVRDGLHLAVNGLVDDGFVNKDDGYMLSEKGAAVLYLYDNVTDTERGLLMRMYRAHCDGREFSVDEDIDNCSTELLVKGLVNGKNANIWLTDYALDAWSGWVEFLNARQKYNEQQKRYQAKKKAQNGNYEASTVEAHEPAEEQIPTPNPSPASGEGNNGTCADECETCVHREVLALIMDKVPAARELYEHQQALQVAKKKMDAALARFK